jgi:hypothetical protein
VNHISLGQEGVYSVKIYNDATVKQKYTVYSLQSGQGWNVDPSPLKDKIIELEPKETKVITVLVKPVEEFSHGIYEVGLNVDSDNGEKYSVTLKLYIGGEGAKAYLPSIKETIDMNDKIAPGSSVPVKLFLENRNPLNLKGLVIRVESEIEGFNKELTVDLPPMEKKTVEFTVTTSGQQQPKSYVVFFVFEHNGEQVKVVNKKVEISTKVPPFQQQVNVEKVFLKHYYNLKVVNNGNVKNTQSVRLPVTFWQAFFTFGADEMATNELGRYLVWSSTLSPGQTEEFNFVVNYRILFYLIVATIIFIIFYYVVRSPVLMKKRAVAVKSSEPGSFSEIKITLDLVNDSKKPVRDLVITDLVPTIANIEKCLELGTIKPKEVKHTDKGLKIIWGLSELDAQEHRLITYKVKAKLNILGVFSLPRAAVEFKKLHGRRKIKAFSNLFRLG